MPAIAMLEMALLSATLNPAKIAAAPNADANTGQTFGERDGAVGDRAVDGPVEDGTVGGAVDGPVGDGTVDGFGCVSVGDEAVGGVGDGSVGDGAGDGAVDGIGAVAVGDGSTAGAVED